MPDVFHVIEKHYIKDREPKETLLFSGTYDDCVDFSREQRMLCDYNGYTIDCFIVSEDELKKFYTKVVAL